MHSDASVHACLMSCCSCFCSADHNQAPSLPKSNSASSVDTHPLFSRQLSALVIKGPWQPLTRASWHMLVPPLLLMWWKLMGLPTDASRCASNSLRLQDSGRAGAKAPVSVLIQSLQSAPG